ncbi:MAG: transpeptidase family protein [Bacteroidetes bacterium]|nr:transpeptidase family protein [Bacteroidota bacterium]
MSKVSDKILKRVYLLFGCFIVFALLVSIKIMRLQWGQGETYAQIQQKERVYRKSMLAERGSILSDDGTVLASTLPFYRLALDATALETHHFPNFADSLDALCDGLAAHFGNENLTATYFRDRILAARQEKDRHIYLFPYNRLFSHNEMKLARQLPIFNQGRFRGGLIIEKENNSRFYPLGSLARVTLGSVRQDSIPSRGIEFSFQQWLRGQDGQMLVQRVSGGTEVPLNYIYERESREGLDIRTTLNVNMQDVADAALKKAVLRHKANWGVAILMEVQTGHIKAIANYPETYNHAVATLLEPGSTFKTASVINVLEAGYIQPDDTINVGQGKVEYDDRTMRDDYTTGRISFRTAFEKSSNIGISRVVNEHYRANPRKFYEELDALGILEPLGFQLKGEPSPYVVRPGTRHFNATTLPWLSIGYNVMLTPLQMLAFYNAIANDGKYIQPLIVSEVQDHGKTVEAFEARVLKSRICSEKTLAQVRSLLEGVVSHGTARRINTGHVPIAGKTSTTQKLKGGRYTASYMSAFVGYFPADAPRYSCIVIIDEPSVDEFYGGAVAAPVVREIADHLQATRLRSLPAERRSAKSQYPMVRAAHNRDIRAVYSMLNLPLAAQKAHTEYVRTVRSSDTEVALKAHNTPARRVPDTRGMTSKDALPLLENMGLRVVLRGYGRVAQQSVAPGSPLRKNQLIILDLQ